MNKALTKWKDKTPEEQEKLREKSKRYREWKSRPYRMTFGMYKGRNVHAIPHDYLCWMIEEEAMDRMDLRFQEKAYEILCLSLPDELVENLSKLRQ